MFQSSPLAQRQGRAKGRESFSKARCNIFGACVCVCPTRSDAAEGLRHLSKPLIHLADLCHSSHLLSVLSVENTLLLFSSTASVKPEHLTAVSMTHLGFTVPSTVLRSRVAYEWPYHSWFRSELDKWRRNGRTGIHLLLSTSSDSFRAEDFW